MSQSARAFNTVQTETSVNVKLAASNDFNFTTDRRKIEPVACDFYLLNTDRTERHTFSKTNLFWSCRLILSIISCLGFMNMYILRFNFSIVMDCMVTTNVSTVNQHVYNRTTHVRQTECSKHIPFIYEPEAVVNDHYILRKRREKKLIWSSTVQFVVKVSFFFGYCVTQIPGGWLAERYGGKHLIGLAILASGILSILIPSAAWIDYKIVIVIRVLIGLAQGVAWPAMYVMWSRWVADAERQKLTVFTFSGSCLGIAIVTPMVSILCDKEDGFGWPLVFYLPGALGIVWYFAWNYIAFDSPVLHPRISNAEKTYLIHGLRTTVPISFKRDLPTPWKGIFTSKPALALIFVHMLGIIIFYSLVTINFQYMTNVLGYNNTEAGVLSATLYIGFFMISLISAVVYDNVTSKHICTRTVARKIGNTIGSVIPAIMIFSARFTTCEERQLAASLIIAGTSIFGIQYGSGFLTNYADLAPQHVGVFYGISNALSSIVSGVGTSLWLSNIILDEHINRWQSDFTILAVILLLGSVIFVAFGSGHIQVWDLSPEKDDDAKLP